MNSVVVTVGELVNLLEPDDFYANLDVGQDGQV